MNVVSYFEPIDSKFSRESSELLDLWSKNWTERGWSVLILNESHAKKHASFKNINFGDYKSLLYSSKNSIDYLKQCYMRWLAYSQYVLENGPTVWCDYDVYNKNLTPNLCESLTNQKSFVFSRSCCCGYLSTKRAEAIVNTIEICSKTNNINDIRFAEESKTAYIHSINPNLFSDMYIANCSFRDAGDIDLLEIASDLHELEKKSINNILNDFNLFHIHGGVNLSMFNLKHTTRINAWRYLDNFATQSL